MLHYSNNQWALTEYGIQSIDRVFNYALSFNEIFVVEKYGNKEVYAVLPHFSEKDWVDIEAFIDVFAKAYEFYIKYFNVESNEEILNKSIYLARKLKIIN